ncbi:hypothetical protein Tco_0819955 [Tanacetum coccineum]|uniref:Uncharacterized protein n=1 Tax=Tanacetum coccineum TaxID=301880 RepID=A0ABQ5ACC6_9ASTR
MLSLLSQFFWQPPPVGFRPPPSPPPPKNFSGEFSDKKPQTGCLGGQETENGAFGLREDSKGVFGWLCNRTKNHSKGCVWVNRKPQTGCLGGQETEKGAFGLREDSKGVFGWLCNRTKLSLAALGVLTTRPACHSSLISYLSSLEESLPSVPSTYAVAVPDVPGYKSRVHTHDHGGSDAPDGLPDSILSSEPKPLRKHRPPPPPSILSPGESSYPP